MKQVLISGGSGGIGASAAEAFARAGYGVTILYCKGADSAAKLTEKLSGYSVRALRCDLRSREEIFALRKLAGSCPDVLINCAGIAQQSLFQDVSEGDLKDLFDVNFFGAFYLTQAFLPGMISRKSGVVLNVSSMWGVTGASCEVAYSASKAALIGMTKALAKEVGPSNIRVNAVAPGVIMTDMMKGYSQETLEQLRTEAPLCRLGTPGDVAGLLVWLASESAAFITGQVIGVDGAMVI